MPGAAIHAFRRKVRAAGTRTGRIAVIENTTVPEEAVAALIADPPDVCFLDIQM